MKTLLLILVCASSAMAQSQNTELVDYLLQLQYVSQAYYDSMMLTFHDARRSLSDQLVELNTAGATEITEGLRAVITTRDEAQASIDEASGTEQCIENAINVWETALDTSGISISSCARQTTSLIQNATEDFHQNLKQQSTEAFEVQNIILNVFAEVNPITEENRITPFVSEQIDAIYNNFNYEVIPQLFKLLQVFNTIKETMAIELPNCIDLATERLSDEALVLRNTLELC